MLGSPRFLGSCAMTLAMTLSLGAVVCPQSAMASNPFCGADASYVPWDLRMNAPAPRSATTESSMRVVLYTASGSTANALVTFITSDSAYQVTIADAPLHSQAAGGDRESDPVLVVFDHPIDVQFAYVDSYALDGAALSPCPSFVNQVNPLGVTPRAGTALPSLHAVPSSPAPTLPKIFRSVYATLVQQLPPLPCGVVYKPATAALRPEVDSQIVDDSEMAGGIMRASMGSQSQRDESMAPAIAASSGVAGVVAVAIASNGALALAQLVRSSGNTITDHKALDQVRTGNYTPAQFLCTPVGSLLFVQFGQIY